ncbi:hypothetical protein Poli38472_014442 [Pythium oligandrum]|uniref:Major facilitator superfamily (MFS) profile domain-containing protein n=1 Tax=Pythium oligandrum TaxID=41045 RepID=A0A8K1FED3_PYTOL|nr:hypothetical protein Poli38472_014442 [Pythium oligandrum]|eukprot:TMW57839.1 hypothetical protein Poli38472_014442 [Pythium oligandrum]
MGGGGFHLPSANDEVRMTEKEERRERFMQQTRAEASYLFKYLIITQVFIYLEAGAIPCLLDQLSVDLHMSATQQGALGGVVYFSLSAASPLCAYLLHRFNPRHVLGASLVLNNLATLVLALTPTGYAFSANLMIIARALIGFTQSFPCIYTPLWVDEYAPREKVAGWMSYLQGSVPMGVMLGYFVGTVANWFVPESFRWFQTWRWPFLVQFIAMCPIMIAIFFVPKKHLIIRSEGQKSSPSSRASSSSTTGSTDLVSEANQSIETAEDILAAAAEAVVAEQVELTMQSIKTNELAPLINDNTTFERVRSKRQSRSRLSDSNNRIISYIEETIKLGANPTFSWSGPNHEEEDVLLASASMYGGTSQRGIRQLHHNQQHQQLENDVGSSSLRRSFAGSMLSGTTDGSPEIPKLSPGVNSLTVTRVGSSNAPHSSSGYGAFDVAIPETPQKSPTVNLLEASMLDDDFMDEYEEGSFTEGIRTLLQIPIFCLIVGGLTAVYFVVTGVQYWSTIFMIKSLHASKYIVNALFVFVAGTGPIFGVFFGGWLIDRCGGYIGIEQRAKALGICMVLGIIAFIVSAATTFFDDIYITAAFLWLLLFFGGSILPACTGIFISVVPAQHRAVASSFSVMIFNLIGYALSPYLTGIVMAWVLAKQGEKDSYFELCDEACAYRIGFRFCLFWSIGSIICIGCAWYIARREAAAKAKEELEFYAALKPYVPCEEA